MTESQVELEPPEDARAKEKAEGLLVQNIALIEGLCRRMALRKGLRPDEVDDFTAWAKAKLVQGDYRVLRRFRGDSSLKGFLTTVLLRFALDYVREQRGKWRPSKQAERAGKVAVLLETLTHRDGVSVEEAVRQLKENHGVEESESELRDLAARQNRSPRLKQEGEEAIQQLRAPQTADERLEEKEVARLAEHVAQGLRAAVSNLGPEDRFIVRLLFEEGFPVPKIAQQLRLDQRKVYTRRDALFRTLRRDLESRGVDRDQAAQLCGWRTWSDALESTAPPEILSTVPIEPAQASAGGLP